VWNFKENVYCCVWNAASKQKGRVNNLHISRYNHFHGCYNVAVSKKGF
jgi:hypothetical protein